MKSLKIITSLVVLAVLCVGCSTASHGDNDSGSGIPDGSVTQNKRVFVTAAGYAGNFGGIAAGDTICNNSAVAAKLGGTWKAWLSDSKTNAIDRFDDVGPWYLLNGKKVFNSKANLATSPIVPINVNEHGANLDVYKYVWTGTKVGGTGINVCCKDWTDNDTSNTGSAGDTGHNDDRWTAATVDGCWHPFNLYCIEQ
jgi:hypothetical protein